MANTADNEIIRVLESQDGKWTAIEMKDGKCYRAMNIVFGYDIGDEWAHVTTNISPNIEGADIDFFFTSEVAFLRDEESNDVLFQSQ